MTKRNNNRAYSFIFYFFFLNLWRWSREWDYWMRGMIVAAWSRSRVPYRGYPFIKVEAARDRVLQSASVIATPILHKNRSLALWNTTGLLVFLFVFLFLFVFVYSPCLIFFISLDTFLFFKTTCFWLALNIFTRSVPRRAAKKLPTFMPLFCFLPRIKLLERHEND